MSAKVLINKSIPVRPTLNNIQCFSNGLDVLQGVNTELLNVAIQPGKIKHINIDTFFTRANILIYLNGILKYSLFKTRYAIDIDNLDEIITSSSILKIDILGISPVGLNRCSTNIIYELIA